jgi:hypothetical protein
MRARIRESNKRVVCVDHSTSHSTSHSGSSTTTTTTTTTSRSNAIYISQRTSVVQQAQKRDSDEAGARCPELRRSKHMPPPPPGCCLIQYKRATDGVKDQGSKQEGGLR